MALGGLPQGGEKRRAVRLMFDRIAPRYDLLNRLLTGGLDQSWRRRLLAELEVGPGDVVVDVASGTGDFAELAAARGAQVVAVDFAHQMLRGAERRGVPGGRVQADAAALPLPDASATVLLCGFALRNFVSLPEVLSEMARVLAPGGRLGLLEVDRPAQAWLRRAHSLYFDRVVPRVGGWLSDRAAYEYLPRSTVYLPANAELLKLVAQAGFEGVVRQSLFFGAAQWIAARRAALEEKP